MRRAYAQYQKQAPSENVAKCCFFTSGKKAFTSEILANVTKAGRTSNAEANDFFEMVPILVPSATPTMKSCRCIKITYQIKVSVYKKYLTLPCLVAPKVALMIFLNRLSFMPEKRCRINPSPCTWEDKGIDALRRILPTNKSCMIKPTAYQAFYLLATVLTSCITYMGYKVLA